MQGDASGPLGGDLARRFNAKVVAAVVVSIVNLITVGIAVSMAWWSLSITTTFTFPEQTIGADFHLNSVCISGFGGLPVAACLPYSGGVFSGIVTPAIVSAFALANALMLVGLVMAILMVVFAILGALRPRAGLIGVAVGFAGVAATLAAPLYLFFALPGPIVDIFGNLFGAGTLTPTVWGFFGTLTAPANGITARWGGSVGWFLSFGAFGLFLVAVIFQILARRSVAALGNYRPTRVVVVYVQAPLSAPTQAPYPTHHGEQPDPARQLYGYSPLSSMAAQPTAQSPEIPTRFCPSCGTPLAAGVMLCPRCGASAP